MNRSRTVMMVVALLLVCAGSAQATGIDPVIIVRGGSGSIQLTNLNPFPINLAGTPGCSSGTWNVPGTDPTAFVNGQSFLTCVFLNNLPNQAPITSLTFFITPVDQQLSLFNNPGIHPNPFFTQATSPGDYSSATFSAGSIPWGMEYVVTFIAFADGTQVSQVVGVPEPGTLALLAMGLGALIVRRRKAKA